MEIEVKKEILEKMIELFPDKELIYETDYYYGEKSIELKFLSKEELDKLIEIYSKEVEKYQSEIDAHTEDDYDERTLRESKKKRRNSASQLSSIKKFLKLRNSKGKKIKVLKDMTEALKILIMSLERKWIFVFDKTAKVHVPYFVSAIFHKKGSGGAYPQPPYIDFDGKAIYRGGSKDFNKSIYRNDLGTDGSTPEELLNKFGILLETDDLMEEYNEHIKKYDEISVNTGLQLVGYGKCYACKEESDRWAWRRESVNLDKGGLDTKLVVDDDEDREKDTSRAVSSSLWATEHSVEDENEVVFELPIHPYIRAFNLKVHEFIEIHVKNTEIYKYNTNLSDKLVLDDDKRELINLLVSSGGDDSKDIVQGKSGGVIIITSGPPGTGKTLTSEVFSEKVERPLYVVQCSQLGTKPDSLEKHLQEVLERAVRWNAVLLIDEADVYIHERGNDIKQNAIVGVFLRVLEYYSGVLFLTTNRACIVDDAIISRCIAHVKYEVPNADERFQLWKILSEQYEASFDDEFCKNLVDEFEGITGRSIKQLIRLAKALSASRKEPITLDTIKWVARFQHLEEVKASLDKKYPVPRGNPET